MTLANITKFSSSRLTNNFTRPENVVDQGITSLFSSDEGVGSSYIELGFAEQKVNCVSICFPRGNERRTKFGIMVRDNKDKDKYVRAEPSVFVSSGDSINTQRFYFKDVKTDSIKLIFLGNADNNIFNQHGHVVDANKINHKENNPRISKSDVGPGRQIFSIRSVAISEEELSEKELENLDEEIKVEKEQITEELPAEEYSHVRFPFAWNKETKSFDHQPPHKLSKKEQKKEEKKAAEKKYEKEEEKQELKVVKREEKAIKKDEKEIKKKGKEAEKEREEREKENAAEDKEAEASFQADSQGLNAFHNEEELEEEKEPHLSEEDLLKDFLSKPDFELEGESDNEIPKIEYGFDNSLDTIETENDNIGKKNVLEAPGKVQDEKKNKKKS